MFVVEEMAQKVRRKHPNSAVFSRSMVYRLVAKFHAAGSALDRKRHILTEKNWTRHLHVQKRPTKSPRPILALQRGV
jgi:hypothetical protein